MSLSQRHHVQCTPTVYPADPFNAKDDAEIIKSAIRGFDTDAQAIVDVLAHRSIAQRLEIAEKYDTMYGLDLHFELNIDVFVSAEFKKAFAALTVSLPQYYTEELCDAISNLAIDEDALIEILSSLNSSEIKTISTFYENRYRNELEEDINKYISGHLKKCLVQLSRANRDENPEVDEAAATRDAEMLCATDEGQWGADESTFNSILFTRSYPQLRQIFQEYERIAGHSIEDAIKREFPRDLGDGYFAVVKCARDKIAFFAERLHKAMSGWGIDYLTLNRIIIGRSEIDLGDIKEKYQTMYGQSLANDIYDETSGHYRELLLAILG